MADQDQPRARGDVLLEAPHDLARVLGRHRDRELLEDDPFAALALLEGREHARVILRGGEHLVAALQVVAELADLKALRGVAGEGQLLRINAPLAGEALAHGLALRLEHAPHRVDGRLVRVVEVPLHRLLDPAGRRAHAAVVQVDQAAVDGERPRDLEPEVLVAGDLLGRARVAGQLIGDACGA